MCDTGGGFKGGTWVYGWKIQFRLAQNLGIYPVHLLFISDSETYRNISLVSLICLDAWPTDVRKLSVNGLLLTARL